MTGWSQIPRLKHFNPLDDRTPGTIKVLQICSTLKGHFDEIKYHDNTHCVSMVDSLLFDPNKYEPIPLNKTNLDSCCVGDEWVFHHVSIAYEFIPGKKMKRKTSSINENHKKKRRL